ncbi:unnamed protein product [Musa acuminata var. zebrina]
MGKPEEVRVEVPDRVLANSAAGGGGGRGGDAGIRRAVSLRCLVVLVLGSCVLLSAIFWFPPFRSRRSGFVTDDPDSLHGEVLFHGVLSRSCAGGLPSGRLGASCEMRRVFVIWIRLCGIRWISGFENLGLLFLKQIELHLLDFAVGSLRSPRFLVGLCLPIFAEVYVVENIGRVSVISMHSLDPENSTYVVFGFLPDPKNASISLPALSILRSTLINLVLQQINISLTSSIFGHPSSFELLKFPGGITVIPLQSDSIWDIAQILFDFTLNNNIEEILENIDRLKDELKFGLNLRSYENVYVKLTNINGSTVTPPVTVEASVLSDMGSGSLLPDRMKQLAQVITRPNANNLGLNNSVFGKVKQVQLSSYLEHSLSMAPGPSPSGSPSVGNLYPEPPASLNPTLSPAPVPSDNDHRPPPCFCCHTFPIKNPMAYAPAPENGIQPDSHSASALGPSRRNVDPFTNCFPCPSLAPNTGSSVHPYPPTLSGHLRHLTSPPSLKAMGPTPKVLLKHSPSSPAASYASRPVQVSESGSRVSPATLLSYASSSLFCKLFLLTN